MIPSILTYSLQNVNYFHAYVKAMPSTTEKTEPTRQMQRHIKTSVNSNASQYIDARLGYAKLTSGWISKCAH